MEARLKWMDGLQFVGEAPSGHAVLLDGGKEGGGADSAVHPMEMLLLALGGCTAMDVISILKKKKQAVTGFEVRLRGERAPDHPKRFTRIELEFVVRGHDIDEAAVARAISLSYEKYCSVRATLQGNPVIETRHRIEPAP
ncbi:MAG: OsmC family protein [Myxococcales bacterium]|nr:OsmC family protein [Myxococcales bacterium]